NMEMKSSLYALCLVGLCVVATAQTPEAPIGEDTPQLPEIVKEEIARRGNLVEELGTTQNDETMTIFTGALQPPPDDSHKWYISVITTKDCPYCELLKKHFNEAP